MTRYLSSRMLYKSTYLYLLLFVELFDVEYYHDLEIWVRGHSRSSKMVPFESCGCLFSHFRVRVRSGSLEMAPFDRRHTSSY